MSLIDKQNQMINAANSEIYRQPFFQAATNDIPENRQPEKQQNHVLFEQYTLHIEEWQHFSRCQVLNADGEIIANWQSVYNHSDFYTPIAHQNGKHYLLFRQDLYGYSVLDLATGEIFQYFPQTVLDGEEDFIWVAVHYNPHNNLLAVEGCYWACPYDTLLLKWDEPMHTPSCATILSRHLVNYFDDYDGDVDFYAWEQGDLLYTAKRLNADSADVERIAEADCLKWLA